MRSLYQRWKKIAEKIGNFQASVIFSVLYFVILTPIGIICRPFTDFLGARLQPKWSETRSRMDTIESLREQ